MLVKLLILADIHEFGPRTQPDFWMGQNNRNSKSELAMQRSAFRPHRMPGLRWQVIAAVDTNQDDAVL